MNTMFLITGLLFIAAWISIGIFHALYIRYKLKKRDEKYEKLGTFTKIKTTKR